ncbi:MAG TPA: MATE family efflux transporter [Puia sp.]|jgi:MATE family multidrug resistance protein
MGNWKDTEVYKTIQLAIPIIMGELAQMSLHLIDTAMVGAISYKHLAAASLVMTAANIPFVIGIGMTISVSQMVSMANGRNDHQLISHYLFNGFILCTAFAFIISAGLVFGRDILKYLHQDPQVVVLALPFMTLVGLSIIPMLLFMTLKQFTDGLEYTKTAMMLSIAAMPVNIFLNWLLIYGNWGFPRLELAGAGYATLITRTLIFVVLALIVLRHKTFRRFVVVRERQWNFNFKTIKALLRIGVPSSMQLGVEVCAFAVSGIIIGTIDAVSQASHQIALSCAAFTFMVSMGLSQAGSIRVSNAYGRSDWNKIRVIGNTTLITALLYGCFCGIIFTIFRWQLPLIFNENPEVVHLSALLLLFAAVFQISDATQATGAGLLRGIKDVKLPTILVTIAYWVIGLPSGWLFAFHYHMGAAGMWLGLIIGLTLASIFLGGRFISMSRKNGMAGQLL